MYALELVSFARTAAGCQRAQAAVLLSCSDMRIVFIRGADAPAVVARGPVIRWATARLDQHASSEQPHVCEVAPVSTVNAGIGWARPAS